MLRRGWRSEAVQRILIVGPCGAGKSTLATQLAKKLGLPLIHMDQLNWRSGWVESSKAEIAVRLNDVVAQDRWVIDGTYGGTLDVRLRRADRVLYLDYPIRLCMARLLRRIWQYRGRSRPDMTEGCPERFDFAFFWYAMRWNSGPRVRLEARLRGHEEKIRRFASPAALEQWLAALT
jgi:adenylate kinase family enzyme